MHRIFLCSMGANIAPEVNFAKARAQLNGFGQAYYSRAIYTRPVAMQSDFEFLNALFLFETELDAHQLKQRFNAIEIALGRDREHPQSATRDRPMDIDILGEFPQADVWQQVPNYLESVVTTLKPLVNQLVRRSLK